MGFFNDSQHLDYIILRKFKNKQSDGYWNILTTPDMINRLKTQEWYRAWFFLEDKDFTYDYDKVKEEHSNLNRELTEYFYHPKFIQTWLKDGHQLEDYLM